MAIHKNLELGLCMLRVNGIPESDLCLLACQYSRDKKLINEKTDTEKGVIFLWQHLINIE